MTVHVIARKSAVVLTGALLILSTPVLAVSGPPTGAPLDPFLAAQLGAASPGSELPVFVHGTSIDVAKSAIRHSGLRLVATWDFVGVAVAVGRPAAIGGARRFPGVTYLEADRPIEFFLDTSHTATRGEEARRGFLVATTPPTSVPGVDGSGVGIAVVDGGIDATHPMFQQGGKSKVVRNLKLACFYVSPCTGRVGNARDVYFVDVPADTDTISAGGHGTHVAGIAAGVDVTTLDGKALHGAAPGAKLVGISVGHSLSIYGGNAGLNWVLDHHAEPCGPGVTTPACPPIKVVNNSWGLSGGGEFDPNSAIAKIENALVAAGVTVVFSAGNSGGDGSRIRTNPFSTNPAPGVIGVANYHDLNSGTRDNKLHSSSSRGRMGAPLTYPDVSAPGSSIRSACRPYLTICRGPDFDPNYGTIGGTSMSAPHIAGIVAQLVQAYRAVNGGLDPTPAYLENLIEDTAYKFADGGTYEADPQNTDNTTSFDKGHGLIDVKAALGTIHGVVLGDPPAPIQPPPFACSPGGAVLVDPKGDTWIVAIFPEDPKEIQIPAYEPSLDIREGKLIWEGTAAALTFEVKVDDLPVTDGTGSVSYNVNFDYAGSRYYVEAARSAGQTNFVFGRWVEGTARLHAVDITGSFDAAVDVVRMVLTNGQLASAGVKTFAMEDVLDGISIAARHAARTSVTTAGPSRDVADASCRFVIGTGAVPPPPPPSADGAISQAFPSFSWTSGPFTRTAPPTALILGDACTGPNDAKCDRKRISADIPTMGATLTVTTTSTDANADFDLYVYGPDGREVGRSERGGSNEKVATRIAVGGLYTVAVNPFFAQGSSYSGVASLDVAPLPGPKAGTFDGFVEVGTPYEWTGDPPVDANPLLRCVGVGTSLCDNERIWLKVPAGGATLTVSITTADPDNTDFSIYVADPNGRTIAMVEDGGGGNQTVTVPVTIPGVYRVSVSAPLAPGAGFQGRASLS